MFDNGGQSNPKTKAAPKGFVGVMGEFGTRFGELTVTSRAASLAYYTTLAIAPFSIIILICFALLGPSLLEIYTEQVRRFLGEQAGSVFVSAVQSSKERPDLGTTAGLLSVATLLISASAVFAELRDSLDRIYQIEPSVAGTNGWFASSWNFVKQRLFSASLVMGFIFILTTSLILSSVISVISRRLETDIAHVVDWVASLAVYVGIFLMLYRYVPSRRLPWRDALRGAILTSVFFLIGKELISSYLGSSNVATSYGAAGSLVVFLLWVYYSATILFSCAVLNEVLSRRQKKDVLKESPSPSQTPTTVGGLS